MKTIKFGIITFFITFAALIISLTTIFKQKSITYELGITIVMLAVVSAGIAIFITLVASILVYLIKGQNKKIRIILICSILAIFISFQVYTKVNDNKVNIGYIGIDLPKDGVVLAYQDTHGGFHGDGDTFAKVEFNELDSEIILSQITNNKSWSKLPLSENLNIIMYGGEIDNTWYGYNFAENAGIPNIKNGYYFFLDRQEGTPLGDDVDLINRYSFNFTFAMYDIDTNILYYYKYDS